jgi:hypothetical protein
MPNKLAEDFVQTIQSAAKSLTGYRRRKFQAEMALKYCDGSPRNAETVFGWRRTTVDLGLHEQRTGIRCIDNVSARGRKRAEDRCPELAQRIVEIVEPESQADPKFQTGLAYTRITAKRVREELLKDKSFASVVPSRQTVGVVLGRLHYSLRRVQKTRPEKRFPKPMRSSRTSESLVR